jgi:hypothetical protein
VLLGISVAASLWRIESSTTRMAAYARQLRAREQALAYREGERLLLDGRVALDQQNRPLTRDALAAKLAAAREAEEEAERATATWNARAKRWYRIRDWAFLGGIGALAIARFAAL